MLSPKNHHKDGQSCPQSFLHSGNWPEAFNNLRSLRLNKCWTWWKSLAFWSVSNPISPLNMKFYQVGKSHENQQLFFCLKGTHSIWSWGQWPHSGSYSVKVVYQSRESLGESRTCFYWPEVEVVLRASTFPANTLHICKRDQESSSYLWTPDCS